MDESAEFVKAAAASGMTDESIILLLTENGWHRSEAVKAVARHHAQAISVPIPAPRRSRESVGIDVFLSLATATLLILAVVCTLSFAGALLDQVLRPDRPANANYRDMSSNAAWIAVSAPLYLALMAVTNRRLNAGLSRWSSQPRQWATALILFLGVIQLLYFAYEVLFAALSGQSDFTIALAKLGLGLVVVGPVMLYYSRWLRGEPDRAEAKP